MSFPEYGTAPIRCGRTRCKFRGFETDLMKEKRILNGVVATTTSICPACGCDEYMFMSKGEIQAWKRKQQKGEQA